MILTELKIHSLRNISCSHLELNSRFNFIIGPNGSGKTSILEALYLLSCGHSFRSREISPMINHDQSVLTVFARSMDSNTISIQKSSHEPTQIKLNNQFCSSTSQLAYSLPCQIFYSDIFQIIDAGPSVRRSVLDWGLFHVKHNYLTVLKEYKRVLKQRNALLKKHVHYSQFVPWDLQLNELANHLDSMRSDYFTQLKEVFYDVLAQLTNTSCSIEYYKGWDRKNAGKDLSTILEEQFIGDNQKLYTQYGAHQADIIIESNDVKAKQILSRGQQKIILIALKLAQAQLLQTECLFLFDDLVAELDDIHLQKLLNYLVNSKGQYVITGVNNNEYISKLPGNELSKYSINSGMIETIDPSETVSIAYYL